jgi:hypothetical protein
MTQGNTAHLHGYEVVRRLRESDDFAVTRIIAISGYDNAGGARSSGRGWI